MDDGQIPGICRRRDTRSELTVVTHGDTTVHGITDKCHDDTKQGQKDPVLAEPGAGMFPSEGQQG